MVGVPLFLHGLPQFGPRPVSLHRRVYDAAHDFVRPNARILLPACYSTPAKFVGPTSGAYFGDTAVALYLERTSVDFVSLIKDNAIRYVLVPSTPLEPWPMKAKHLTTLFEGIYGHPLDATEFPLQSGTALADLTPSLCNLESRLLREMVGALGGEVRAQVPGLGTVFELYRGDVPQFRLVNGGVQTAEGENINVTKGVQGWVEGAELHNGQIEVVGWAVADKNSAPIRLLAFSGERLVINMTASLPRLDVNNHLKADYQAPGFAFTVPADLAGKGKPEMRFFAVTPDFHYQELPCNPKSCVFLPPG